MHIESTGIVAVSKNQKSRGAKATARWRGVSEVERAAASGLAVDSGLAGREIGRGRPPFGCSSGRRAIGYNF